MADEMCGWAQMPQPLHHQLDSPDGLSGPDREQARERLRRDQLRSLPAGLLRIDWYGADCSSKKSAR